MALRSSLLPLVGLVLVACQATPGAGHAAPGSAPLPPAPAISASSPPPPSAGSTSPPAQSAPITFALRGTTYRLGEDRPFPSCERPEGWLAFVEHETFRDAFCARCGESGWCSADTGDESGGPWSFASDREPREGFWCNELKYVRYAMGAELGLAVPSGRYQPYFGYRREYHPDDSLTEADLPAAARKNLSWIDEHLARCNESDLEVTSRDEKLVDEWFRANYAASASLPKKLTDNCNAISETEFRALIGRDPYVGYSPRTPIVRRHGSSCDVAIPKGGRVLSVHVGAWLTAEMCSECEGHQILEMVVDANDRIVALGAFLSG